MNQSICWTDRRVAGVHMTIRDVDCDAFDVDKFIEDMKAMKIDFFSFFAGGYVTTYPTELKYQRVSPYLEKGVDLAGEIVEKAYKAGIAAIPMVDLGILPRKAADDHPDWALLDKNGEFQVVDEENIRSCLLGGWQTEYAKEIVGEIISRYPHSAGMKFGGASYGFTAGICYCPNCTNGFFEETGLSLPKAVDWSDPTYNEYVQWRYKQTAKRVKGLHDMVKKFNPDLVVMGNSVCFGNPTWTLASSLDQETMVSYQDVVQIEAQERVFHGTDRNNLVWQSLTMTSEEAIYMESLTDKPILIVASYFLAWPWRRTAMEYAEQKHWLYQIIANGANPMINLAGGPPKVHEDKRGFKAPTEVFSFYRDHMEYYQDDSSMSEVAIVYSQQTMVNYGRDDANKKYVSCIRGFEQILLEKHVPFDIIPSSQIKGKGINYRVLILANVACMSCDEITAIEGYVQGGGRIVATSHTSLFDSIGKRLSEYQLAKVLGISSKKQDIQLSRREDGQEMQSYGLVAQECPDLPSIKETRIIPIDHFSCTFELGTAKPLINRTPSFRVFPEGLAYPKTLMDTNEPLATINSYGSGDAVYFGWPIDREYWEYGQSDLSNIIFDVIESKTDEEKAFGVEAPKSVLAFFRKQETSVNIHLINGSGGKRLLTEIVPVYGIRIFLPTLYRVSKVHLLKLGEVLTVQMEKGRSYVVVPKLEDYEVVVFKKGLD